MIPQDITPEHNFLEGLSADLKKRFLHTARFRRYRAGALIHQSGDDSRCVSMIQAGTVRMSNIGRDGGRVTLADLVPGESFGLVPLLSESPRTHDAHALTDVSLLELSRPAFRRLMDDAPEIRDYIISQLARRLMRALEAVEIERRYPLKARLAKLILQKTMGSDSVRTTQTALADELGASRYGVGLALKEMTEKRLIQTGYGAIRVLDSERLGNLLS